MKRPLVSFDPPAPKRSFGLRQVIRNEAERQLFCAFSAVRDDVKHRLPAALDDAFHRLVARAFGAARKAREA